MAGPSPGYERDLAQAEKAWITGTSRGRTPREALQPRCGSCLAGSDIRLSAFGSLEKGSRLGEYKVGFSSLVVRADELQRIS